MKKRIQARSLFFVGFLYLCTLLSCNNNKTQSDSSNSNSADGAITEQQVKNYFTHLWTHDCQTCSIVFNTAVRINPREHHQFQDGLAVEAYPVKVDFTSIDGSVSSHHTGGVYYFYQNSFKEWEMAKEGVDDLH